MANYNMDPIHLRTHEINYELRIRGVATTNADMPQKRRFLRRELQKDIARPGVHVYEVPNFSFEAEKRELDESIKSVTALVDDFDGTNKEIFDRIRSRLVHITGRIKRIPDNIGEEICGYRGDNLIIAATLESDLEEIMERHGQGEASSRATPAPIVATTSKSFPVHKWNLTFNGTSNRCSVNSFLEQVEELSFARNVSEEELYRSAIELFEGPAKVWYRLIRKKVTSWNELVAALRRDFLPKDSDDDLWEVIRNRKQKKDERVIIFVAAMENLFDRLIIKATKAEKLKIVRKNLLQEYHIHLALKEIESMEQLAETCRILEEAGIIRENVHNSTAGRRNISSLEPDLAHLPTQNWYRSEESSQRVKAVSELRCFQCKQLGHVKRNCRMSQRRVETQNRRTPTCFGCGKEGVIKPNCPNCSKNSRAGDA